MEQKAAQRRVVWGGGGLRQRGLGRRRLRALCKGSGSNTLYQMNFALYRHKSDANRRQSSVCVSSPLLLRSLLLASLCVWWLLIQSTVLASAHLLPYADSVAAVAVLLLAGKSRLQRAGDGGQFELS